MHLWAMLLGAVPSERRKYGKSEYVVSSPEQDYLTPESGMEQYSMEWQSEEYGFESSKAGARKGGASNVGYAFSNPAYYD